MYYREKQCQDRRGDGINYFEFCSFLCSGVLLSTVTSVVSTFQPRDGVDKSNLQILRFVRLCANMVPVSVMSRSFRVEDMF
ncbi:hypothetical protein O9929_23940 [Vibrio lentus]|nr:hypothetical protein [Vibrio lentus]